MILSYLCVFVCELFFNLPVNTTAPLRINGPSRPKSGELGFISPFLWAEDVCNYCYEDLTSFVENASLYTSFLLFTRESWTNYSVVDIGNIQLLAEAGFNSSKDTKIVIHGWNDNGTKWFAEEVKNAYLKSEDVNLITANWPELSMKPYVLARSAVTPVGRYAATLVDFLVTDVGQSPESIHLVGHSLGAHVAGIAGEYVTFGNLSRVTGLDPAGPLFNSDPQGRLDASDAEFVDVIHTTAGYLGYANPCGTVDFYPNGGVAVQPGCGLDVGFCSHERAYDYFSESISSLGFISTACSSWEDYKSGSCANNTRVIMGEHVDLSSRGVFYLYTDPTSPFAKWNDSFTSELRTGANTRTKIT